MPSEYDPYGFNSKSRRKNSHKGSAWPRARSNVLRRRVKFSFVHCFQLRWYWDGSMSSRTCSSSRMFRLLFINRKRSCWNRGRGRERDTFDRLRLTLDGSIAVSKMETTANINGTGGGLSDYQKKLAVFTHSGGFWNYTICRQQTFFELRP